MTTVPLQPSAGRAAAPATAPSPVLRKRGSWSSSRRAAASDSPTAAKCFSWSSVTLRTWPRRNMCCCSIVYLSRTARSAFSDALSMTCSGRADRVRTGCRRWSESRAAASSAVDCAAHWSLAERGTTPSHQPCASHARFAAASVS
eukprot:7165944-Prymnesium_polylepis.1